MCVRILAGKELHKYVIRKVKCVTIPFSTKTTFHLVAPEEYRHEHVCPVQNKSFEQKAGSGGKCQSSSLHFSSILTTVTIRKKFTACKIGHFGLYDFIERL